MSDENVEVVRASYQAWNPGDMDAFRELHHPDAILRPEKNWPEPGPFVGRDAVMGFYRQLRETFDADTIEQTRRLQACRRPGRRPVDLARPGPRA